MGLAQAPAASYLPEIKLDTEPFLSDDYFSSGGLWTLSTVNTKGEKVHRTAAAGLEKKILDTSMSPNESDARISNVSEIPDILANQVILLGTDSSWQQRSPLEKAQPSCDSVLDTQVTAGERTPTSVPLGTTIPPSYMEALLSTRHPLIYEPSPEEGQISVISEPCKDPERKPKLPAFTLTGSNGDTGSRYQSDKRCARPVSLDLVSAKRMCRRPLSMLVTPKRFYSPNSSESADSQCTSPSTPGQLEAPTTIKTNADIPLPHRERNTSVASEQPYRVELESLAVKGSTESWAAEDALPNTGRMTPFLTAILPESDPWRRHVYIHGPMRLDPPGAYPRRIPANISLMEWQAGLTEAQAETDEKVVNDVIDYFKPLVNLEGPCDSQTDVSLEIKPGGSVPILDGELARRIAATPIIKAEHGLPQLRRAPSSPLPRRFPHFNTFGSIRSRTSPFTSSTLARKILKWNSE